MRERADKWDGDIMDYRLLMDTAVLAGEIMLSSGAETYRVEDTISHMLKMAKLKHAHVFVTATGIFATLSDPKMDAITVVRRIEKRSTNLNKIYLVNDISRRFCAEELDLEGAFHELKRTKSHIQYSQRQKNIGVILTVAFFCLLLGGSFIDCVVAAGIGIILTVGMAVGRRIGVNSFILDGVNTAVIAVSTLALQYTLPFVINTDMIIIGAIMPMVPGVAITNAIRDTLQGDYMSGGARILEAFVEAVAIALGACLGISMFRNM